MVRVGLLLQNFQIIRTRMLFWRYLLKRGTTWNDLKRPTSSKKRPETTYNEQETAWNDLQRARNNLKRPITSKTQPTTTRTYLQRAKKIRKTTNNKQILRLFYTRGNRFSSLTRFQPKIWLQSFEHCFTENHSENRAPNISILSCLFITGYVANHSDTLN